VRQVINQVTFWVGVVMTAYKLWRWIPEPIKYIILSMIAFHLYHHWYDVSRKTLATADSILEVAIAKGPDWLKGIRSLLVTAGNWWSWLTPEGIVASEPAGTFAAAA
jgi:hypothetical protein